MSQLQALLRERNKENRRLKSSFDTIKDLNDNMKKQVKSVHIRAVIVFYSDGTTLHNPINTRAEMLQCLKLQNIYRKSQPNPK